MESIWTRTAKLPEFPHLEGDIQTDVLIIGGGLAGLLCGYFLRQAGVDCRIAEAKTICDGTTKNTTAKITAQHGLIYAKLLQTFGREKTAAYLEANQAAVERYRELALGIDCDFFNRDSFVYALDDPAGIEKELRALAEIHASANFAGKLPLPFPVAGAVRFFDQAQFHPLKFAAAIAVDLPIVEHTPIRELVGTTAITDFGRINAKKIIVATHFPFLNKHGSYFLKMYQQRSYLIALENGPMLEGMYVDANEKGLSFRNYGSMLLLGGGGHRTGKQGGGWEELRQAAAAYYPGKREVCHWAAQDCMTLDDMPYIGAYSARTKDIYVATGFRKWGMTGAMVAATVLTDLVQEKENPYASVFSPSRSILRRQLAVNAAESTINLLTPSPMRCPHMGCSLKWNAQEHTWDCPCHGSRFTEDGKLIDNPATGDMKSGN